MKPWSGNSGKDLLAMKSIYSLMEIIINLRNASGSDVRIPHNIHHGLQLDLMDLTTRISVWHSPHICGRVITAFNENSNELVLDEKVHIQEGCWMESLMKVYVELHVCGLVWLCMSQYNKFVSCDYYYE